MIVLANHLRDNDLRRLHAADKRTESMAFLLRQPDHHPMLETTATNLLRNKGLRRVL